MTQTDGAVLALMPRGQVDLLHAAHEEDRTRFVPRVPDAGGREARDRQEWYIAALELALFHGDASFDTAHVRDMDAQLGSYREADVDWARIHAYAVTLDPTVPGRSDPRYWDGGGPLSVRAFRGEEVSADLAEVGQVEPSPVIEPIGVPASTVPVRSGRGRLGPVVVAASMALVATLGFAAYGYAHPRVWTKVDKPAAAEAYRTGTYLVIDDHLNPCRVGQSWVGCTQAMDDQYARACLSSGPPPGPADLAHLTPESKRVCDRYGKQLEWMRTKNWAKVAERPRFGRLERVPEIATRPVPAVTHRAVCRLGTFGECD